MEARDAAGCVEASSCEESAVDTSATGTLSGSVAIASASGLSLGGAADHALRCCSTSA